MHSLSRLFDRFQMLDKKFAIAGQKLFPSNLFFGRLTKICQIRKNLIYSVTNNFYFILTYLIVLREMLANFLFWPAEIDKMLYV